MYESWEGDSCKWKCKQKYTSLNDSHENTTNIVPSKTTYNQEIIISLVQLSIEQYIGFIRKFNNFLNTRSGCKQKSPYFLKTWFWNVWKKIIFKNISWTTTVISIDKIYAEL